MKKYMKILSISLVLVFMFTMTGFAEKEGNIISVQGKGSIKLKPDTAVINFTVQTKDKTQVKALEDNAKKMNVIMKAFKDFGIKEEDISSDGVKIEPIHNYNYVYGQDEKELLEGYRASNNISVTTKNLDKLGKILDIGIKSGADEGGYIGYSSTVEKETYIKALELAVKDGEKKASAIANAMGKKSIKVKLISELGYYDNYKVYDNVMPEAVKADSKAVPVDVKDLIIDAVVEMNFTFE